MHSEAAQRKAQELEVLRDLWRRQQEHAAAHPEIDFAPMGYLASHFELPITLERHLHVLDAIAPHVRGNVLEWGCAAGIDSCVYRMRLGNEVELHGCDVQPPLFYEPFYAFSGMHYSQLQDTVRLPYSDQAFDVVTSNGVLEHVPDDQGSLREVHRILRPGGRLIIACLPNRYSYTEAYHRWRSSAAAHERPYSLRAAQQLLERAGLHVLATERAFMLPTMLNGFPALIKNAYAHRSDAVWLANAALERVPLLNLLASNLLLVAEKPRA